MRCFDALLFSAVQSRFHLGNPFNNREKSGVPQT